MLPSALASCAWPVDLLGDAVSALARRSGLANGPGEVPNPDQAGFHTGEWIDWAAKQIGCEAEPLETTLRDIDSDLEGAYPAIVKTRFQFFSSTGWRWQAFSASVAYRGMRSSGQPGSYVMRFANRRGPPAVRNWKLLSKRRGSHHATVQERFDCCWPNGTGKKDSTNAGCYARNPEPVRADY